MCIQNRIPFEIEPVADWPHSDNEIVTFTKNTNCIGIRSRAQASAEPWKPFELAYIFFAIKRIVRPGSVASAKSSFPSSTITPTVFTFVRSMSTSLAA